MNLNSGSTWRRHTPLHWDVDDGVVDCSRDPGEFGCDDGAGGNGEAWCDDDVVVAAAESKGSRDLHSFRQTHANRWGSEYLRIPLPLS